MSDGSSGDEALAFAERILTLLDSTRYSTTYKLATLLAIIDVAAEVGVPQSDSRMTISDREVGKRLLEMYWPHAESSPASRDRLRTCASTGSSER